MIDRDHDLSLGRQAKALGISRGSVYYLPRQVSDADLKLMRRTCELHLEYPFAGSRMLGGLLRAEGHEVGRLHVATLMKKMGIEAIYRRPRTSKPAPGHKIYPYLLRNLAVTRPNQVWGDGHHLRGLWRAASSTSPPSSTGSAAGSWPGGCRSRCRRTSRIEALEDARFSRHGRPDILQRRPRIAVHQRRLAAAVLKGANVVISMDGSGRVARHRHRPAPLAVREATSMVYRQRSYTERLRDTVLDRRGYFGFYNTARSHSSVLRGRWLTGPTSTTGRQSRRWRNQGGDPLSNGPEAVLTDRATSRQTYWLAPRCATRSRDSTRLTEDRHGQEAASSWSTVIGRTTSRRATRPPAPTR